MFRREKLVLFAVLPLVAVLSPAFALAAANQTPEQTSVEAAALNNQAVAAVENHHYQEAIELFKQAIALRPDSAMAHYNLGRLYQTQDQFRLAIDAFNLAAHLNPAFADAHHYLGVSYNKIEHFEDAIECFKRALRLTPDRADSLSELGFAYFMLG